MPMMESKFKVRGSDSCRLYALSNLSGYNTYSRRRPMYVHLLIQIRQLLVLTSLPASLRETI
jgi:hypothetical protein